MGWSVGPPGRGGPPGAPGGGLGGSPVLEQAQLRQSECAENSTIQFCVKISVLSTVKYYTKVGVPHTVEYAAKVVLLHAVLRRNGRAEYITLLCHVLFPLFCACS